MNKIKITLLLGTILLFGQNLKVSGQTGFGCDAAGMILTAGAGTTTNFYKLNTSTVPMHFDLMFTIPYVINSTAFNPKDSCLYAFPQGSASDGQTHMYRIDATGAVTQFNVTAPTHAPAGGGYKGGSIDNNGIYYLSPAAGAGNGVAAPNGTSYLYFIDLKQPTQPFTTYGIAVTGNPVINLPDIAWNPVDNNLYGVDSQHTGTGTAANGTEGYLDQFVVTRNATTGYPTAFAMTRIGTRWTSVPGDYSSATDYSFGGLYIGKNGLLFGSLNNGGFYQIHLDDGSKQFLASSPASSANDGAACPNATFNFAADLQVTKDDGLMAVMPGNSTTYTIVVTNNGPYPAYDATVSDPLPADIPAANVTFKVTAITGTGATSSFALNAVKPGPLSDVITIPAGGSITYQLTLKVPVTYSKVDLRNIVTVDTGDFNSDPVPENDTAYDDDEVNPPYIPINPHIRGKLK